MNIRRGLNYFYFERLLGKIDDKNTERSSIYNNALRSFIFNELKVFKKILPLFNYTSPTGKYYRNKKYLTPVIFLGHRQVRERLFDPLIVRHDLSIKEKISIDNSLITGIDKSIILHLKHRKFKK